MYLSVFAENNSDSKDNERGRKKGNMQILCNKRESDSSGGLGMQGLRKKKGLMDMEENKNNIFCTMIFLLRNWRFP